MSGWQWAQLGDVCDVLDSLRRPITKRDRVPGPIPYYGASGVLDHVEGQLFNEPLVLLGEDGAKWDSGAKSAFAISGPAWVNNHAHVLRPLRAKLDDAWLIYYLNFSDLLTFVTGLTVPKLNQEMMRSIPIPLPPLAEQKRIIAILDEAFEGIDIVARNTSANLELVHLVLDIASNDLLAGSRENWAEVTLTDVCRISSRLVDPRLDEFLDLPHIGAGNMESRSGRLTDVLTAREEGLVSGKFLFDQRSVLYSKIRPYLMKACRPDFTGLCSADVYPLVPNPGKLNRDFLFHILMGRAFTAYAEAGSARAGMPKVNREHLFAYRFYVPSIDGQADIAKRIDDLALVTRTLVIQLEEKLRLLAELKQSLLARAFSGELNASTTPIANDNDFATPEQAANILAFMYWQHERVSRGRFFGHVMGQKTLDLVERVGCIELGREPYKDAAGPNDRAHMAAAERWAKQQAFFEFAERSGGGYDFKKLSNHSVMLAAAKTALKPVEVQMARVTDILVGKDKVEAEVFDTVLAAWNNVVADGAGASDAAIIYEARENWHPDKLAIPISKFQSAIQEIRRRGLVPDGSAKVVRHRQASLL